MLMQCIPAEIHQPSQQLPASPVEITRLILFLLTLSALVDLSIPLLLE